MAENARRPQTLSTVHGEYVAVFRGCYNHPSCGYPRASLDRDSQIPVPANYQIVIDHAGNRDDDSFKPFNEEVLPGWPPDDSKHWIDQNRKILYFSARWPCPKDSFSLFRTVVAETYTGAEVIRPGNTAGRERALGNTRAVAQAFESKVKGLYQNMEHAWDHFEDNAEYQIVRHQPYGNYRVLQPTVPGAGLPEGRTEFVRDYE